MTPCLDMAPTPGRLAEPRRAVRPDRPHTERVGPRLPDLFQTWVHLRGQAHTLVLEAGIDPPQLDDFYLEYGRVPSAQAYFGAR